MHYLEEHNIHIAAVQETKFHAKTNIKDTLNYNLVRKDRGRGGGGLAFLIHKSVPFNRLATPNSLNDDDHLEELTIEITSSNNQHLRIRNVYIPPASSCKQGYVAPINHLDDGLNNTFLILGDVNAHHQLWHTDDTEDARGQTIADWLGSNTHGILNEDSPTRITATCSTSPDLSIASSSILTSCDWRTNVSLSSDHLPIHIKISTEVSRLIPATQQTFINFKKADWAGFRDFSEQLFSNATATNNVHNSEKFFRSVLNKAAKRFIPAGRIPEIYNDMPTDTANLLKERDSLRQQDPADIRIPELTKQINQQHNTHRTKKWLEHLENCGPNSQKLWSTIKGINNPKREHQNQSISFNSTKYLNSNKIANKFNSQFTPASTTKPSKEFRRVLRNIRQKPKDPAINITTAQTANAIKRSKNSKALGPDNIAPIMLKYLGPAALSFLTDLFNNVVNQAIIPPPWKVGRIIPILKPNKPKDEGTSFRPISLLSPPAKILESIVLEPLNQSITLAPHQHGFRKGRSTITALQEVVDHVTTGLNSGKPADRTVLVAVDLSKAFDTVNHELLLNDIAELPLNSNLKRFLFSYLRGRSTYVEFRGKKSRRKKMKQGVPQGGVLSPLLFNLYMSKMPTPPTKVKLVTYADDGSILSSDKKIGPICDRINAYLETLNTWFSSRNLFISAPKSSATLFTTWSNEAKTQLPINIAGTAVPTVQDPKILGVTLDPLLTFKNHAMNTKAKVIKRNNILKALAGSSWGKEKEVLKTTYTAISKSVLSYAAPIWTPTLSETNWAELQRAQNASLRTITGCTKMTDVGHLHTETKEMPVKEHCEMLSRQFLLGSARPSHPNHKNMQEAPKRLMKHTLATRFKDDVLPLTTDGITDEPNYKKGLKTIHCNSVLNSIRTNGHNKVLNDQAPNVNITEINLPRRTRTILSQLRSGYSTFLNSYLARIKPAEHTDHCPDCGQAGHTTQHLFQCPSKPTELEPRTLWEDPPAAATFLGLPTFQDPGELDDND